MALGEQPSQSARPHLPGRSIPRAGSRSGEILGECARRRHGNPDSRPTRASEITHRSGSRSCPGPGADRLPSPRRKARQPAPRLEQPRAAETGKHDKQENIADPRLQTTPWVRGFQGRFRTNAGVPQECDATGPAESSRVRNQELRGKVGKQQCVGPDQPAAKIPPSAPGRAARPKLACRRFAAQTCATRRRYQSERRASACPLALQVTRNRQIGHVSRIAIM